jgi:cellulose biosynthesis protein BcsQ
MTTLLRDTFAKLDDFHNRLKAVSVLLGVTENTLRTTLSQSGIDVKRMNQENPNAPAIRIFDIPAIFKLAQFRRKTAITKHEGSAPEFISIEIVKGGTGKSTTAAEVGVHLQLLGFRVLLVDLDSQANLTQLMGYEADLEPDEASEYGVTDDAIVKLTFASLVKDYVMNSSAVKGDYSTLVKRPFGDAGPAIVPADANVADIDKAIAVHQGNRELIFRNIFKLSADGRIPGFNVCDYDVVLLDCPPSVSFTARNAIAAADIIVAPVKLESFAVKGLSKLFDEIKDLREQYGAAGVNPDVAILPTYFQNAVKRTARMQSRLSRYRDLLAPGAISHCEEFPRSTDWYLPLTLVRPTIDAVKEYRLFAEWLAAKVLENKTRKLKEVTA